MVNLNSCFGADVGGCGSIEVSKNNKEVQEIEAKKHLPRTLEEMRHLRWLNTVS